MKTKSNIHHALARTASVCLIALGLGTIIRISPPNLHAAAPTNAGDIDAKGAFTCDFALSSDISPLQVGPAIERDRMYMSERPGMLFKQLPVRFGDTGNLLSGGRYLFDTEAHARDYLRWVRDDFVLDGVHFFDRPYFIDPECHAWSVIGAHDFAPRRTSQFVLRTERWVVPNGDQSHFLKARWPAVRTAAEARGLTNVWLLYSKGENLVSLVYFADRLAPANQQVPDFASLAALETAPPLGQLFADQMWNKYFDRTHWVLTVWFPFVPRDYGEPALWPYSPPLPGPYCGDGVCEVSRGERNATCPGDCPPQCGDGICQPGENTQNCPGDCRLQ